MCGIRSATQSIPKHFRSLADLLHGDPNNGLYAELLGMSCTAVADSSKQRCDALVIYAETHPDDAKAATYAASMLFDRSSTYVAKE
ncbi:MAG: hypothetical protein WB561_12030 [Terracidiphilus sp.]